MIERLDGLYSDSGKETLENLAQNHFPGFSIPNDEHGLNEPLLQELLNIF